MSGGEGKGKSVAGYVSADIVVTEEMMREARALAGAHGGERRRCGEAGGVVNGLVVPPACPPADPHRFKTFLEDEFTRQACVMLAVTSAELMPRTVEDFRMEVCWGGAVRCAQHNNTHT